MLTQTTIPPMATASRTVLLMTAFLILIQTVVPGAECFAAPRIRGQFGLAEAGPVGFGWNSFLGGTANNHVSL